MLLIQSTCIDDTEKEHGTYVKALRMISYNIFKLPRCNSINLDIPLELDLSLEPATL
jgi:hypothetical protein